MTETFHLDDLVIGTLPEHIISAISKMELTVEEYHQLELKKPKLVIIAKKGFLDVKINLHIPIKKLVITASAFASILGVTIKIIVGNWSTFYTLLK